MFKKFLTQVLIVVFPTIILYIALSFDATDLPLDLTHSSISLLIAHPDDEAMFFGPTLHRLSMDKFHNNITIVCFSSGDFEGIGETRKQELIASANLFNIPATHVHIIDDKLRFPDSQQVIWNETLLAYEITGLLSPNTKILTFDEDGISGHANHRAIYHASLLERTQTGRDLFVLKSLPTWRKYLFSFDALISQLFASMYPDESLILITSPREEITATQSAMTTAHVSQMKWFRYGWITLSRYMVANDLLRL